MFNVEGAFSIRMISYGYVFELLCSYDLHIVCRHWRDMQMVLEPVELHLMISRTSADRRPMEA